MNVFIVMEIIDFEYGCRGIAAVFESYDDAEKYIEDIGNQQEIEFWNGYKKMLYTIEEWDVL